MNTFAHITFDLLCGYIVLEIFFYVFYRFYLIPRANERLDHKPFLCDAYSKVSERHTIMVRIVNRILDFALAEYNTNNAARNSNMTAITNNTISLNNCCQDPKVDKSCASHQHGTNSTNNNTDNDNDNNNYKSLDEIRQVKMQEYFYKWFYSPGYDPANKYLPSSSSVCSATTASSSLSTILSSDGFPTSLSSSLSNSRTTNKNKNNNNIDRHEKSTISHGGDCIMVGNDCGTSSVSPCEDDDDDVDDISFESCPPKEELCMYDNYNNEDGTIVSPSCLFHSKEPEPLVEVAVRANTSTGTRAENPTSLSKGANDDSDNDVLKGQMLDVHQVDDPSSNSITTSSSSSSSGLGKTLITTRTADVISEDGNKLQVPKLPTISSTKKWTIPDISRNDMDKFLAWGMYGKLYTELDPDEIKDLQLCHDTCEENINLVLYPAKSDFDSCGCTDDTTTAVKNGNASTSSVRVRKPRLLSFEKVNPLHRPLAIYFIVYILRCFGSLLLRLYGFQRVVCTQTGLCGWYRPADVVHEQATCTTTTSTTPIVFFHGIAPGGLTLYLPMLNGMFKDERKIRPLFLFENPNIATTLGAFKALSEIDTCKGISAIIQKCLGTSDRCQLDQPKLCVIGHSFGTLQVSWMIHSSLFRNRLESIILLDPVSIMLSEPDVMVNFLYEYNTCLMRMIARLFASSELFTEYYIRRHFAWYNSELWFENDIIQSKTNRNMNVIIALSGQDVLVNSPKVKEHIKICCAKASNEDDCCYYDLAKLKVLYWANAGHADCVKEPTKWDTIRQELLRLRTSEQSHHLHRN